MNHPLPGCSYALLKKIIIAYSMFTEETVNSKQLSESTSNKINRTDIIHCTDFLVSLNLLSKNKRGSYTILPICKHLGDAFRNEHDSELNVTRLWREIIKSNEFFETIIKIIEATEVQSGITKVTELKTSIVSLTDKKSAKNYHSREYALTVIYILKAAKFIRFVDSKTIKTYKPNSSEKFISTEIIEEFKKIDIKKFNLSRLIHFCDQINENYDHEYYESVAFTTRALMDHVPPIFGQPNFESIAPQTSNGKTPSFKKSCDRLNGSLKHIVDDLIHSQINAGTSLLIKEEINFSPDLNTFLRKTLEELKKLQSQNK